MLAGGRPRYGDHYSDRLRARKLISAAMKKQTLFVGLFLGTAFWSGSVAAASVQERLAAQNALFDEQYESDLKNQPELATAYGDYRFNDQLNDYSLAGAASQHRRDEDFLARL